MTSNLGSPIIQEYFDAAGRPRQELIGDGRRG